MLRSVILCILVAAAFASPVDQMRSMCDDDNDSFACMKYKLMSYLETIISKDNYKLTDAVEVRSNGYTPADESRGDKDVFDKVEDYIQSHDATFNFPAAGAEITLSPKDGELDLNVKFAGVEARGKKSKLKKIMIPILVFVLLKAMTLVPLALGVLGLKAWNALQLSFFSFIVSFALAVFQLCKKLAADNHHPQISTHGHFVDAGRSFVEDLFQEPTPEGQDLAYNAYV
ncbi:uncharacterized protein Osi19 [Chironomus tepperi]|uniref:uncharacterized protein Osi19 n=1 Tax=Chironomus tepperi TaxID=113505 RepID=UPI00391FA878